MKRVAIGAILCLIALSGFALILGAILCLIALSGCTLIPGPPPIPPDIPINSPPIAYPPSTTACGFERGERVDFDLRFREHGCEGSGGPMRVTGARDPDGDPLEYKAESTWTVFGPGRETINGQWISFPMDDRGEQQAIVTLFVGCSTIPPYPYQPKACDPVGPWFFQYSVRDGKGGIASNYSVF